MGDEIITLSYSICISCNKISIFFFLDDLVVDT